MNHRLASGVFGILLVTATLHAEEPFSKAIRPEDFAAAELDKLSPEALARLDGLVQAYKSGAVSAARAEAEAQAARIAAERARELALAQKQEEEREKEREKEKAKTASPGFFKKAKVLLTPGTEVEYGDIETTIAGPFTGWGPHTVFTLENGQHWKVANGDAYDCPRVDSPKVRVFPATFGGFWMKIEGVSPRVKVLRADR